MRIVTISDTHTQPLPDPDSIPKCDVLIHAGDITEQRGLVPQLYVTTTFLPWFNKTKADHLVFVAGNHDWVFRDAIFQETLRQRLIRNDKPAFYLQDSGIVIDDVIFYGSPWTPYFFNWEFNGPENPKKANAFFQERWSLIPDETNVLITHGPPNGILDQTECGDHAGEENLLKTIRTLPNLQYHFFGHIHEQGFRKVLVNKEITNDVVTCYNASYVDLNYRPRLNMEFPVFEV